ncbi:hypothetical protein CCACVL1_01186 [Corchorus capsularis]|uniref:Uncharacterized protein n=1 Tax=Corchorus capsularis TaxID=210143 RepID=A0A1R3KLK5_COCAP|nr:hypothetical protein CCACVL1_01186 [Corchorus capsularis]
MGLISASRASIVFSSSPPSPEKTVDETFRKAIRPPSISVGFRINRYKMTETDAFRPTSPGHSPGVGHNSPPSSP